MAVWQFARRPATPVVLGVVAAISSPAIAGPVVVNSTWDLGADGNWNVAGNWDPATVPNNGGGNVYNVTIDGMRTNVVVDLNIVATIDDLTVTTGDELQLLNGVILNLGGGDIVNAGLIDWAGTGSLTRFIIQADTELSGGGVLDLRLANDRLEASPSGMRLTNLDNTIQGGGQIGVNNMSLTNQSLVDANDAAVTLVLDPVTGGDFTNNGTMRASSGGTLQLSPGLYDNTFGVIAALNGSTVNINSSTNVIGGELTTSGSGVMRAAAGTSQLAGVTNTGDLGVNNGVELNLIGSMSNQATLTWFGTGSLTRVFVDGDVTLTGAGVFDLGAQSNNRLEALATLDRLTNIDNTIRGGGQVGLNTMSFTNQSLLEADLAGITMSLDPPTNGDFTNNGTFRASNGGIMSFLAGLYDNSAGLIEAADQSEVRFHSASEIVGGEVTTSVSGVVRVFSGAVDMTDVTNTGNLRLSNATDLHLVNSLVNEASVTWDGTGSLTRCILDGDVTLTGGGSFDLGAQTNNRLEANTTLDRLTNVDNTIHGGGQVGINTMSFTNQALLEADLTGVEMRLDPPTNGDFTNEGTFRASNGGIMSFLAGLYDNSAGLIEAADLSEVRLHSASGIVGGEVTTSGSGVVRVFSGAVDLTDVTNTGNLRLSNATDLHLVNSLVNEASVTWDGVGSLTRGFVDGDVTLTGGGSFDLGTHSNNRLEAATTLDRLINVDNTITGGGQIGLNTMSLTNQGVINADHATVEIRIDPPTNGDFSNQGQMIVSGDAGMTILSGPFTTSGAVEVQAGTKLTRTGNYDQTAGTTTASGEVEVNSGTLNLQGGVLNGSGLVDANVANSGGDLEPGASIGLITVEGNYTQGTGGALTIELENVGTPGIDHDQLVITGNATLGGQLRLEAFGAYVPQVGDTFTVLTAGAVLGRFESIIPCGTYAVSYTATSVEVEVVGAAPVFGDLSCDGDVDAQDVGFMCLQLGLTSADPNFNPQADLDDDGDVDYDDRAILEGIAGSCAGDAVSTSTFAPPPDGVVDAADLAFLLGQWGIGLTCADTVTTSTFAPPPDGIVDAADLAVLLGNWGPCD